MNCNQINYLCFMVTIYALINPLNNNEPFYVGKTESIKYRLSMHNSDFMRRSSNKAATYTKERDRIIKEIRESGLSLEYITLMVCPKITASRCEQYIYDLLIRNGYKLLQRKSCG